MTDIGEFNPPSPKPLIRCPTQAIEESNKTANFGVKISRKLTDYTIKNSSESDEKFIDTVVNAIDFFSKKSNANTRVIIFSNHFDLYFRSQD